MKFKLPLALVLLFLTALTVAPPLPQATAVPTYYSYTFYESGLPSGTSWYVTVDSTSHYSTGTSVTVSVSSATHSYVYETTIFMGNGVSYNCGGCYGSISGPGSITMTYTIHSVPVSITIAVSGGQGNNQVCAADYGSAQFNVCTSTSRTINPYIGDSVTFTAIPYQGLYSFIGWTSPSPGTGGSTQNPISASITTSGSIYGNFQLVTYSATFHESGLPAGTRWGVTIARAYHSSTTTSLTVPSLSGTNTYQVDSSITVSGGSYQCVGSCQGSVTSSTSVSVTYTFIPTKYSVTFQETGLPSGASWNVRAGSQTGTSTTSSTTITNLSGSNSYAYVASVTVGGDTYTCHTGCSGTVTTGTTLTATYVKSDNGGGGDGGDGCTTDCPPTTFTGTWTETGLPSGTTWGVTVGGSRYTNQNGASTITLSSLSGSVSYTYDTTVGTYNCQSGCSGTVTSSSTSATANYGTGGGGNYDATFLETGLPSGTVWGVTVGATRYTSSTSSTTVSGLSGSVSYSYDSSETSGGTTYSCNSQCSGSVSASGSITAAYGSAPPSSYSVVFQQTGLPVNATWGVTVSGLRHSGSGSSITVSGLTGAQGYSYDPSVPSSSTLNYACGSGCTGTVSAAATETAAYKIQYYLTMNSGPEGTVSPASGWQDAGKVVTIRATPSNSSYRLARWTCTGAGCYSGAGNPASLTMAGPISETASFGLVTVLVTVTSSPVSGNGYVSVDGAPITTPRTYNWTAGRTHTLAANSTADCGGGGACTATFKSWSDKGAQSHAYTVPGTRSTVTALFTTVYAPESVTFEVSGMNSDAVGPVLIIDGTPYTYAQLPLDFTWRYMSAHAVTALTPVAGASIVEQFVYVDWANGGTLTTGPYVTTAPGRMNGIYVTPGSAQTVTCNYSGQIQPSIAVLTTMKRQIQWAYLNGSINSFMTEYTLYHKIDATLNLVIQSFQQGASTRTRMALDQSAQRMMQSFLAQLATARANGTIDESTASTLAAEGAYVLTLPPFTP